MQKVLDYKHLCCLQKYTNHDLVKYLESIGAEFGACQNAYTSADDTVYEFQVPTDDAELEILDRSFDVFAEFATKIRCIAPKPCFDELHSCKQPIKCNAVNQHQTAKHLAQADVVNHILVCTCHLQNSGVKSSSQMCLRIS